MEKFDWLVQSRTTMFQTVSRNEGKDADFSEKKKEGEKTLFVKPTVTDHVVLILF
jgi:hypothetical protein